MHTQRCIHEMIQKVTAFAFGVQPLVAHAPGKHHIDKSKERCDDHVMISQLHRQSTEQADFDQTKENIGIVLKKVIFVRAEGSG